MTSPTTPNVDRLLALGWRKITTEERRAEPPSPEPTPR